MHCCCGVLHCQCCSDWHTCKRRKSRMSYTNHMMQACPDIADLVWLVVQRAAVPVIQQAAAGKTATEHSIDADLKPAALPLKADGLKGLKPAAHEPQLGVITALLALVASCRPPAELQAGRVR